MARDRVRRLLPDLWVVALILVLLLPLRKAGYPFAHDMVFTPHQPLKLDSVGLGTSSPRAVPLDALAALASRVVDGAVVARLGLVLPLLAAGWGARRLLRSERLAADLLVGGFAVWNPFVVERLGIGQWALLWAYGALPWLVVLAGRLRTYGLSTTRIAALVAGLGAAAITPTGALIAGAVVVACTCGRRATRSVNVSVIGTAAAVQLPWLLPSLMATASATSDPRGVAAFAARAEHAGGPLPSLLGLGGIWDSEVVPGSRSGPLGWLTAVVVLAAVGMGWPLLRRRLGPYIGGRLAALGVLGLVLAAVGALPLTAPLVRWAVRVVPGAGLLRDGQKWLMPFVLLAVLCAGAALERWYDRRWVALELAVGAVLPLVLLPDAAATLRPVLTPIRWSTDWTAAAHAVHGAGDVLALPFASYHAYPFTSGRTAIDPTPRWVAAPTVVDDRLVVSGSPLRGEDRRAHEVGEILATYGASPHHLAARLAAAGIRWVLVQKGASGPPIPDLSGLRSVLEGPNVGLFEVPGPIAVQPAASSVRRVVVIGVDALLLAAVAGAWLTMFGLRARRLLQLAGNSRG